MRFVINHPRILLLLCGIIMWLAAWFGVWLRTKLRQKDDPAQEDLALVVTATLTLLGLIVSFTFSMAATRYDQRKLYEEQEANAIGTEYIRADRLPPAQKLQAKQLLKNYLQHRIDFYQATYGNVSPVDTASVALQSQLWESVQPDAATNPNPVTALVVSGMNDVINSQGYTQFAWSNRIPTAAWILMLTIAAAANIMLGYSANPDRRGKLFLLVMPTLIAIAFLMVAEIDSPRGGIIQIHPENLKALADTLRQLP